MCKGSRHIVSVYIWNSFIITRVYYKTIPLGLHPPIPSSLCVAGHAHPPFPSVMWVVLHEQVNPEHSEFAISAHSPPFAEQSSLRTKIVWNHA